METLIPALLNPGWRPWMCYFLSVFFLGIWVCLFKTYHSGEMPRLAVCVLRVVLGDTGGRGALVLFGVAVNCHVGLPLTMRVSPGVQGASGWPLPVTVPLHLSLSQEGFDWHLRLGGPKGLC